MWKKYFFISLGFNLVVILTFVLFSFIFPIWSSTEDGEKRPTKYPLSASQIEKSAQIKKQMTESLEPWRTKILEDRLHLWAELMAEQPDTQQVNQILNELIRDENQLKKIRYHYYPAEKLILTPEQRIEQIKPSYEKLRSNLEQRKQESATGLK